MSSKQYRKENKVSQRASNTVRKQHKTKRRNRITAIELKRAS